MTWHQIQDARIDLALDAHDGVFAAPSPVRRTWGRNVVLIADRKMKAMTARHSNEVFCVGCWRDR